MFYKGRPIEVDAFQLGYRPLIGEDWFWDAVSRNDIITHNFGKAYGPAWCTIKSKDGTIYRADVGDWIAKLADNSIIQYPDEVFKKFYQPMMENSHEQSSKM